MFETFLNYKNKYNNYILIIRSGNFYICINNDALLVNKILNYKIKCTNKYIKIGFPIFSLSKVKERLNIESINYIIIDKSIELIEFLDNKYYIVDNNYLINIDRINRINNILSDNILNSNIDSLLDSIEGIIWKINY